MSRRIKTYFSNKEKLLPKTAALVASIAKIEFVVTESEFDALLLEANLIRKFQPKYNFVGKSGGNFYYVEIPSLKISRQKETGKRYLGPYPLRSNIRQILKFLKTRLEVFPFVPDYEKNLTKLINLLDGKRHLVQKQLVKEMNQAACNQEFEKAQKIKETLRQLELLTAEKLPVWRYEENPNLVWDLRQKELEDLARILGLPKIHRIEAYDISHTAGKEVVGSMVVFTQGTEDYKQYRKFKIKTDKNDDVIALREVLNRRFQHHEWETPDLIVIDGGKPQLSVHFVKPPALKVIALAKRKEIVFTDDQKEICLSKNSPALHLLQRLRDEAHRFSRRYHLLRRAKKMLE